MQRGHCFFTRKAVEDHSEHADLVYKRGRD